jgi:hypothetical protein
VSQVNWKDMLFKAFWTGVAAALGVLGVEVSDLDVAYAPILIAGINYVLAFVRQQLGATPPDAPTVSPLH